MNKTKLEKILYYFVLSTLVLSIIFIGIRIIYAPTYSDSEAIRTKSSYSLMFVQCILGVIALHLPDIFMRRFSRKVPSLMVVMYIIFLYAAIFLGEVRSFYYNIPNWDTILHTFSGGMLGALGFSIVTLLNKTEKIPMNLSPFFVSLFAFSFAITIGVFWEFYEFSFDGLLGLNMQKFMLEDGTQLIGRAALADTMEDLFVDALGAFIISLLGYLSIRYKGILVEKLHFEKIIKTKDK